MHEAKETTETTKIVFKTVQHINKSWMVGSRKKCGWKKTRTQAIRQQSTQN